MNPIHTSTPSVTLDSPRAAMRGLVRAFYDVQALRIQSGNRLFANFRAKLGLLPSESEATLPDAFKDLLARIRAAAPVPTDAVVTPEAERMRREAERDADEEASALENAGIEEDDDADEDDDESESPEEAGAKKKAKKKIDVNKLIERLLDLALDDALKPAEGDKPKKPSAKARVNPDPQLPKPDKFRRHVLIPTFTEAAMIAAYRALRRQEAELKKHIEYALGEQKIWNEYLANQPGCGAAIAGVLVSEIDIHKARYASSLWAYAGYDVASDGLGRSKRSEHLVEKQYIDKKGKQKMKKSITFSPFLKTKVYLWASCLIKASAKAEKALAKIEAKNGDTTSNGISARLPLRQVFIDYKKRLENHAIYGVHNDGKIDQSRQTTDRDGKPSKMLVTCAGRRNAMAMRYIAKMLLRDLYVAWRTCENLPVAPDYAVAKLGYTHGQGPVDDPAIPTGQKEALELAQTLIDAKATASAPFRRLVGVIQARFGLRWNPEKNVFTSPAGDAA